MTRNSNFLNLKTRFGFTLIELLVVISIIGILITLVMVAVVPVQRKSRDARRKADVNSFLSAANLFKADFKIYPNSTFNLGSQTDTANTDGDTNSNFGIAGDVFACNNATLGATVNFAILNSVSIANPSMAQLNNTTPGATNKVTLKPGFASVNNFLICLKYTNSLLTDPKPTGNNQDKYQYRVSYDYGDIVVTSYLENATTDSDATVLFIVTGTDTSPSTIKRYNRGSGVVIRHLDDSSDTPTFWNYAGNTNTNNNGRYLYQCKSNISTAIKPDDRVTYEPITSGASYAANSNCLNTAGGLDVVQAY